jgi:uncharacterized protein
MQAALTSIREAIKKQFDQESTGHDWYHIERVTQLALQISATEGGNKDVIELAGLLHDISDHKFNGGDFEKGGKEAERILLEHGIEQGIIEQVVAIVNTISYKGANVANKISSLEGKIVQDADRIDAIGAIGIARTFAYGGHKGHPIYDPKIKPQLHDKAEDYQKTTHTINHFYEKLLLLKDRMNTETGRRIAEERHQFMEDFLERFYSEWNL